MLKFAIRSTTNAFRRGGQSGRRYYANTTLSSNSGSSRLVGALGLAIASGFAGYFYATQREHGSSIAMLTRSTEVGPRSSRTSLSAVYGTPQDFVKAIEELREQIPNSDETVATDPDTLQVHGYSMNDYHTGSPHTVVVYPDSTEDVVKIVNISRKYKMPIVPYSGGTSLEGNLSAPAVGSICVDLSNMNKILQINEADGDLICQAGAGYVDINEQLRDKGIPFFFPLDPAPGAAIGGMISTGCSGTNAVRYGTARGEWFLNITVVLPSGEVIKTRSRARKSSAGFDLTKLFIGAEGTLGIITEATIRLAPLLDTTVAVCQFPSVQLATEAVREILATGIPLQCVELVDEEYVKAANAYGSASRKWAEEPGLFFKFQGSRSTMADAARSVLPIVNKYGGHDWEFAKNKEEADELWQDRKNALYIGLSVAPGARGWSTDVCVPVSKLPQLVQETKDDLKTLDIKYNMVGHVGDGNFHTLLLFSNKEEQEIAHGAVSRMVERAIKLDGTCTGEHGVGRGKKKYLKEELGEGTVELMKSIKKLIDPGNLFNPGKLYPDDEPEIRPTKQADS